VLSKFEIAAAATRARMKEIMGPRRRPDQSSSAKYQGKKNWTHNGKDNDKKPGGCV
jgi:hypothetical protein